MVITVTHEEFLAEQATQKLSTADKVNALTASNTPLDAKAWSDQQLRAIPDALLEFAWNNSAGLRKEFVTFGAFVAYRRHLK